jgi:HEAT repeat protein
MKQRILFLIAIAIGFGESGGVRAQLNSAEQKLFHQLLAEPDGKPAYEKRLKLIGDAIEREADPKARIGSFYEVSLKQARIPAEDGVPFLLERLDHKAEPVKRTALRMLAAYGPEAKAASLKLQQVMNTDTIRTVRDNAVLTLAKIEPKNGAIAGIILQRLLAEGADEASNRATLQALISMAPAVPKSAIPDIRTFQEPRSIDVRILAHELIGKILALERPTLEQLRAMKAIDWRDAPDEGFAVFASIADAGNKAEFAAPLLLEVLDSKPPPYVECIALDTLAKLRSGGPPVIRALLERITSKEIPVRIKARAAVSYLDLTDPASVRALAAGLRHPDRNVRLEAAFALRRWDEPGRLPPAAHAEILPPLLETLAELDDTVLPTQVDAYLTLLRRFGSRAAPAAEGLVKFYQSEAYFKKYGSLGAQQRGKLLAVLANIGVPESGHDLVLNVLRKGPADPIDGGYAYAAAARAASAFAEPTQLIPLLLPGLAHKGKERELYFIDWSRDMNRPTTMRLETIRALAKIGPPAKEVLPILREIAETNTDTPTNPNLVLGQEARRAFQTISGTALPPVKGFFADGKKEMLHLDERLQVKTTLNLRHPRPGDVLKRFQQATNLTFTMDDKIDRNVPVTGGMQFGQTTIWFAMRQMAAMATVQGVWVDLGDGYHLVRKSDAKLPPMNTGIILPFRDDSFDPMPDDPRLRKLVTIQLREAKIQDVLQAMRNATGVALAYDKVDSEMVLYGSVNWTNTPGWIILRNVAESPKINGVWEKTDEGYRLRGDHIPPPVIARPVAPTAPGQPDTPPPAPRSHRSLLICGGVFFAIGISAVLALLLRWQLGRSPNRAK